MTKIESLAQFLNCETSEISVSRYDENVFEHGREEYLILTDSESDERVAESIKEFAWAFNPEFLAAHMTDIDASDLKPIQEKCESANPVILKLIDDVEHFVNDAVLSDGRGHFLASYDGDENDLNGGFFAYRLN